MNELALFAGAGGGILGGKLLGWRTVCAVEFAPYPRRVLLARQRDGILPRFPIWDDVTTFDGRPWKGRVDVVSGGFPCQDISAAGRGAGISGQRSGLWAEMARIVGEVQPKYVFVENSPMLTSRGLDRVLGDLSTLGYDAQWGVLGAIDAGAPHERERIWIVADTQGAGQGRLSRRDEEAITRTCCHSQDVADAAQLLRDGRDHHTRVSLGRQSISESGDGSRSGYVADTHSTGCEEQRCAIPARQEHRTTQRPGWWSTEPDVGRVANGVASILDIP